MKNKMLVAVLIGGMFHIGCGGLIEPQPQESCYTVCGETNPACFQTGTISSEECPSPSASCITLTEPSSDCRCYVVVKGNWLCLDTQVVPKTGIPSPLDDSEAPPMLQIEAGQAEAGQAEAGVGIRQVGCIPACQEGESCYTVCGEIGSACFPTGQIQANGCPSPAQECLVTDAGTGCSINEGD